MSPVIVAATVGGIFTLLSPMVTLFIKKRIENSEYKRPKVSEPEKISLTSERFNAITGIWKGSMHQPKGPSNDISRDRIPLDFDLEVTFRTKGKLVKGVARYLYDNREVKLLLEGGFIDKNVIKLDYHDADKTVTRYGTVFLYFSGTAQELYGHFLGYAAELNNLTYGDFKLEKVEF